jgi:ketosteroid isomerase-like protein
MTTSTSAATVTDTDVARAFFRAAADADPEALTRLLHADATWHHHNDDRLGGTHQGSAAVMAYLAEAAQLTAGTLRAVPQLLMADGEGHVSVLVRLSATRPDGRSMDGPQLVLLTIDGGRVRSINQFVGDPAAVTEFWA